MKIVCTNDFLGSVAPHRTSYGSLPGGHGLSAAVERLRPAIWADAGDWSQGGPLSTTTGGVLNFAAAKQLGIDVATVGNHEFDWGLAHLEEHRAGLPLICANVEIGLPPTLMVDGVGFVGLTHPQVAAFTPFAPPARADTAEIITTHGRALRAQGATHVVVLIHFGVNWSTAADGTHLPDPTPVLELLRPTHDAIDAVVLGHTLGRWADVVDGIPYVQPWAFGAELGVIDLEARTAELVPVEGGQRWTGAGHAAIDEAESSVVGQIDHALTDLALADFAAETLRVAAGTTAAVMPIVGMHQPAIGGVMYHWPAGPVTEADLSRFCPWTDDRTLVAELSAEELDAATTFTAPEPWLAWGTSSAPNGSDPTIAVPRDYVDWGTIQIEQIVGRSLDWKLANVRLRDALRTALAVRTLALSP